MLNSTAVLLPEDHFSFDLPALVVKVTPQGTTGTRLLAWLEELLSCGQQVLWGLGGRL